MKLPLFEGPFDLLLFFIERDELDIHDIPIFQIAEEFLGYLKQLEEMDMEGASEFILVASTLMRIKSRMLLPRMELDEEGGEIDPRDELVAHLLEYKKYKSVLGVFSRWEDDNLSRMERGNVQEDVKGFAEQMDVAEEELMHVDLYKLLKVYQRVLARYERTKDQPVHSVAQYPYTIEGQKASLLEKLGEVPRLSFKEIIQESGSKVAVIFNFLAVLEMLQLRQIALTLGEGYNNFWIERAEGQN